MKNASTLSNRHFSLTTLSGLVGLVGVVALLVTSLVNEYRVADRHAQREVENLSRVLEEHALASVQKVDLLLRDVQRHAQPADMRLARDSDNPRSQALHALLKSYLESVPEVSLIHLINAHGEHIHSSLPVRPNVNLADRPYFQRQKNDPAAGLVISAPVVSRVTGNLTLILSRRVDFENGDFAGTVQASLDMAYFQQLYRSLDLGKHGLVMLYDKDLHLAARFPPSESNMGKVIVNMSAKPYIGKGVKHGVYHAISPLDGIKRLYGFRQVRDLPLIVIAGIAEDGYLAEWRRHLWQYGIGVLIFGIVVMILLRRQSLSEEIVREKERKYRTLFETANDGIFLQDASGFVDCNQRGADMYGLPKEALIARSPATLCPERQPDGRLSAEVAAEKIQAALNGEPQFFEWRPLRADNTPFDTEIGLSRIEFGGSVYLQAIVRDITERKQLELQKAKSLSLLQGIFDATAEGILVADSAGHIVTFSRRFAELWRMPAEILAAGDDNAALAFVLDQLADPETFLKKVHQLYATPEASSFDIIKFKDGRVFERFSNPQRIDGKTVGRIWSFRDVTERIQAEAALKESEERWMFALEGSGEGVWDWNIQTGQAVYSKRWKEMLGFAESEIENNAEEWTKRVHPEDMAGVIADLQAHIEGKTPTAVIEFRMLCKDGGWKWILGRGMVVEHDADGKAKRLVGTNTDITERKLAEAELRIAATVFESHEGMFVTDAENFILRVNKAFTQTTGYSAEEAVGNTPRLLKSGRHDAAFYAGMWANIHATGTWQGEIWNRRKNGEIFPEWLTITAVKGSAGKVTHYVATLSDITQRKAAEEEIQHLAFYDPLTNLPNRRLLLDRLQQALATSARSGHEGALLFIDMDNFKDLNDTLGHGIGDLLLQQVAQRLATCVREGDTVARLGGDEFVVMLEGLSEQAQEAAAQAENVGQKIIAALNQTYQLAQHQHHSTPSIGVTLFNDHERTVEELLKRADLAMYQAKAAGRNTMRFYDSGLQQSARH